MLYLQQKEKFVKYVWWTQIFRRKKILNNDIFGLSSWEKFRMKMIENTLESRLYLHFYSEKQLVLHIFPRKTEN
jgi:hypothetical protein